MTHRIYHKTTNICQFCSKQLCITIKDIGNKGRDIKKNYQQLLMLRAYLALHRKTLSALLTIFSFALLSSISGFTCAVVPAGAHKLAKVHTYFCSISLEAPLFCLHGCTIKDSSLTNASCLRESVQLNMNFVFWRHWVAHSVLLHTSHNYYTMRSSLFLYHISNLIHQCYFD